MWSPNEINGHPSIEAHTKRRAIRITVCSECEKLKSILFLSKDRWLCTSCRAEGDARPTQVHFPNPINGANK